MKNYKNNFQIKVNEIKNALFAYLSFLESESEFENDISNNLKVTWNTKQIDDENALNCIIRLAQPISDLRGVVPAWETNHTQGSDYSYASPIIEEPTRAITQLQNLARGHTLSQGRNSIKMDNILLIIKIVLSNASRERITLFNQLLKNNIKLLYSRNLNESPLLKQWGEITGKHLVIMDESIIQKLGITDNITIFVEQELTDDGILMRIKDFLYLNESGD
jgi:hypothetical protein